MLAVCQALFCKQVTKGCNRQNLGGSHFCGDEMRRNVL